MGVRGNVRRSVDGHIIHTNVDTDVMISDEPEYGSTAKPEEMYAVIEHFSLGALADSFKVDDAGPSSNRRILPVAPQRSH